MANDHGTIINDLAAAAAPRHGYAESGSTSTGVDQEPKKTRKRKGTKHVNRACNPCRQKKSRCNGERPACAPCVVYGHECTYDTAQDRRRPVSKAYVTALEHRVSWLEQQLGNQGKGAAREGDEAGEEGLQGRSPVGRTTDSETERHTLGTGVRGSQKSVECLQIDAATGEVREYGPTSVFKHLPVTDRSLDGPPRLRTSSADMNTTGLNGITTTGVPGHFDQGMHQQALQYFFTFFNPWCWWVNEEKFRDATDVVAVETGTAIERDLHTAYYSPLLHCALIAIGVMYLDPESCPDREAISNWFGQRAATFFEGEIETPKLSTVIGLMLLGSHHAGHARQNLGYIYSGSGLRLTRILGLGVNISSWVDKGLISPEAKHARYRAWHTCYIQDKLWSTYVGRAPAPNLSYSLMPPPAVNEEEDTVPWGRLDGGAERLPPSLLSSCFAWTYKLTRIIELILTNVVLLEKWQAELPNPLRVRLSMLRNQSTNVTLPHVLVMNMMFYFALILLNRPDYHDMSMDFSAATSMACPSKKCHHAAESILHLARLFDYAFGLPHAPISMSQFVYTAGSIRLHSATQTRGIELATNFVNDCITTLRLMGRTWKSASQSGDALERLLHEWLLKQGRAGGALSAPSKSNVPETPADTVLSASTSHPVDIQELLQQRPEVAHQLQRLGWVPPRLDTTPQYSSSFTPGLERLLITPDNFAIPPQHSADQSINDILWMSQPSGWVDYPCVSAFDSTMGIQEELLIETEDHDSGTVPQAWHNNIFNVETEVVWPPG